MPKKFLTTSLSHCALFTTSLPGLQVVEMSDSEGEKNWGKLLCQRFSNPMALWVFQVF